MQKRKVDSGFELIFEEDLAVFVLTCKNKWFTLAIFNGEHRSLVCPSRWSPGGAGFQRRIRRTFGAFPVGFLPGPISYLIGTDVIWTLYLQWSLCSSWTHVSWWPSLFFSFCSILTENHVIFIMGNRGEQEIKDLQPNLHMSHTVSYLSLWDQFIYCLPFQLSWRWASYPLYQCPAAFTTTLLDISAALLMQHMFPYSASGIMYYPTSMISPRVYKRSTLLKNEKLWLTFLKMFLFSVVNSISLKRWIERNGKLYKIFPLQNCTL